MTYRVYVYTDTLGDTDLTHGYIYIYICVYDRVMHVDIFYEYTHIYIYTYLYR